MSRPVFLIACPNVDTDPWLEALRRAGPEFEFRVWPDAGDWTEIEWVLAWDPPVEIWANLPNLKAVFSLGAGVDKILAASDAPEGIPLVRMVDPNLVEGMTEYVLMRVLHYHRLMPDFERSQSERKWTKRIAPLARERRVGVMGLGQLGGNCAQTLASFGFRVSGWSRSRKAIEGVRCFAGQEELQDFAAASEIVVCLLPLTPATQAILDARFFLSMPRGGYVINVSRGANLVDDDLLAALADGQVAGATLDVFPVEPLPEDHAYWSHPGVVVTPHISALTNPTSASEILIANLREHLGGAPLQHVVDRKTGY